MTAFASRRNIQKLGDRPQVFRVALIDVTTKGRETEDLPDLLEQEIVDHIKSFGPMTRDTVVNQFPDIQASRLRTIVDKLIGQDILAIIR